MTAGHVKLAIANVRSAKWRSMLTMLGIIIGIVSVVTTVSLGEGVRRQIAGEVKAVGQDTIVVRPGQPTDQSANKLSTGLQMFGGIPVSGFTEHDVATVRESKELKLVVPFAISSGVAQIENRHFNDGLVVATDPNLPQALRQKIEFGTFFSQGEMNRQVVVIGKQVAQQLFKENVPVGRTLRIRDQEFIVRGVFEEFHTSLITPGADLNKAVFIPYPAAKNLNAGAVTIVQILAKAQNVEHMQPAINDIRRRMRSAHGGQEDFSVQRQADTFKNTSSIIHLVTQMISGIAAISLLVGGIGIMNIMLVSVTERTREIGIRKALGATNRQILNQFLVEAAVLSFTGGLIGVVLSVMTNFMLRMFTNLDPVITLPVILAATSVSWLVGILFGVTPAIRAARKDPIEALRYE